MAEAPVVVGSYWTLAGETVPPPGDGPEWSPFDFRARVERAAAVGFAGMGLWHADLRHVLEEYTLEEMRAILAANGIEHVELEFVEYGLLAGDRDARREGRERVEFLLEAAEALDAHHVKFGNIGGVDVPRRRVRALFRDVADRFAAVDTAVGYEVITADVNLSGLSDALDIVGGVANGGLVLDTWHSVKLGIPGAEIRTVPADLLVGVELNDGYHEIDMDPDEETTGHRLLPGEGEFDVVAFVEAVRATGYDGPWGVEVLSEELRRLPMDEAYPRAYERTVEVLRRAGAARGHSEGLPRGR